MEENNKYYTPEIEEFHVGFEYEYFNKYSNIWIKEILLEYNDWFTHNFDVNSSRVKYLDREDIESLFEQEYDVYRPLHMYYGFLPGDTLGKSLISYNFSSRVLFIQREINDDSSILFNGTIKNKSELIKLLKQLGIN